jgi:uncharacterized membrane protein HdeD (DUF308 family)
MNALFNLAQLVAEERAMLRRNWGWFVAIGVVLTMLGIAGLAFAGVITLGAVLFLGWMFLVGGVIEIINAVIRKGWQGFWLDLLSGVLTLIAGVFILLHPVQGASVLTLLIGILFLIGGIFRVGAGVAMRNPYAGWFVLQGVISLVLGLMIVANWPFTALWVIGTLVAIDLLITGLRLISFGLEVRKLAPLGGEEERRTGPSPAASPTA